MRFTNTLMVMGLLIGAATGNAQTRNPMHAVTPLPPDIPLQVEAANPSDALLELGRAAKVNFLVDATEFPADGIIASQSALSVEEHLSAFAGKYPLTWLHRGSMILVWKEPSISSIARRIIAGESVKIFPRQGPPGTGASAPTDGNGPVQAVASKPSDADLLVQEVLGYFRENQGLDKNKRGEVREALVSQLPPNLRAKVISQIQADLIGSSQAIAWKMWFQDVDWDKARLQVMKNPVAQGQQLLMIGGSVADGLGTHTSMFSLGRFEEAQP